MDAQQLPPNTETLGALIDKLSIVNLKLWHCQELLYGNAKERSESERKALEAKNTSLLEQRQRLIGVIDAFVHQAVHQPEAMLITNPQNKLYGRFRSDVAQAESTV